MRYYTLDRINRYNATYNIVIGERSNGKTYAVLKQAIYDYFKTGGQLAIVRRWKEDITGNRASNMFKALEENGEILKASKGEYQGIHYWAGAFYLCSYDDKGKAIYSDQDVIAYPFALSQTEHNKSISFPKVTTILFDEFLTRSLYLNEEFVLFMNTISTIVRQRSDVKIYMLANTVNKYSPYFEEMGLTNIKEQEQGTIDLYKYGNSKLTVAVEYTASNRKSKESNFYFAFNNPKLEMITGGAWEIGLYPHIPFKFTPKDIKHIFFIEFNDELFQCEIVKRDKDLFIYIHRKTTDLQTDHEHVYSIVPNSNIMYNNSIKKPRNKIEKLILQLFTNGKVFYQDNSVGDTIRNYLNTI